MCGLVAMDKISEALKEATEKFDGQIKILGGEEYLKDFNGKEDEDDDDEEEDFDEDDIVKSALEGKSRPCETRCF